MMPKEPMRGATLFSHANKMTKAYHVMLTPLCKEAGLVMTGAGATFPYGRDPKDSNIRIAPSFPTPDEMEQAADLFALCVKLASVEKLLETK